ncbi:hypothetical protein GGX14DRAFT_576305 [Mycena pura]|uniref:Uncharacterized protein n=1 Tax=Mycena pura TaxID=153505 RepID=A0AAD6Y3E0_9AGAR|nr:hypothetical protein GGX14DRAFT_576305 [Mycena pura]
MELYRMFPDLVKAIQVEGEDSRACFSDPFCVLSKQNPYGISAWKMLPFSFWAQPDNPLGSKWTLSPEDVPGTCRIPTWATASSRDAAQRPFVPHALRDASPLIYVMAKDMDYFKPESHAWEADYYTDAADAAGAHFMVGAYGTLPEHFPQVLENVGLMPQDWFYETLSKSALLIGVGRPWTSPTMYGRTGKSDPKLYPGSHAHGCSRGRLGRILETDWKAEAEILAKDRAIAGKGTVRMRF